MKKMSRNQFALITLGISLATTIIVALLFSVFPVDGETYGEVFATALGFSAALVGAPGVLTAFLLAATKMHESATFGFGCAMWYGFGAVYIALIEYFGMTESGAGFIGAVIACLVAAVAWLGYFKSKYKE